MQGYDFSQILYRFSASVGRIRPPQSRPPRCRSAVLAHRVLLQAGSLADCALDAIRSILPAEIVV